MSFDNVIDTIVPSPIAPQGSGTWLYIPRAVIVVPLGGTPPPTTPSYYLQEDGVSRFLTEDNLNLLILEA